MMFLFSSSNGVLKYTLVICILLGSFNYSKGQQDSLDYYMSRLRDGHSIHCWIGNSFSYYPVNEASDISLLDSCENFTDTYVLNHVNLTEDKFSSLEIKGTDLTNDQTNGVYRFFDRLLNLGWREYGYGYYYYNFNQLTGEECVNEAVFLTNVQLSFMVNGNYVEESYQEEVLSKLNSEEIVSVKREKALFGKDEIHITTKTKSPTSFH